MISWPDTMFTCPKCNADRSRVLPVDPCTKCGAMLAASEAAPASIGTSSQGEGAATLADGAPVAEILSDKTLRTSLEASPLEASMGAVTTPMPAIATPASQAGVDIDGMVTLVDQKPPSVIELMTAATETMAAVSAPRIPASPFDPTNSVGDVLTKTLTEKELGVAARGIDGRPTSMSGVASGKSRAVSVRSTAGAPPGARARSRAGAPPSVRLSGASPAATKKPVTPLLASDEGALPKVVIGEVVSTDNVPAQQTPVPAQQMPVPPPPLLAPSPGIRAPLPEDIGPPPEDIGPPPELIDLSYSGDGLEELGSGAGREADASSDGGNAVWREAHPSAERWAAKRHAGAVRAPRIGVIALGILLMGFGGYLLLIFLPSKAPLTAAEHAILAAQAGVDEGSWRFTSGLLSAVNINAGLFALLGLATMFRGLLFRQPAGQGRARTMGIISIVLLGSFVLLAISFAALVMTSSSS